MRFFCTVFRKVCRRPDYRRAVRSRKKQLEDEIKLAEGAENRFMACFTDWAGRFNKMTSTFCPIGLVGEGLM